MHYDGTLRGRVSINNPIMKDKKTGRSIAINRKLSPLDIEKLNKMYPCKSKKSTFGKYMSHNGSQLKNPGISGALYTLRIQYSYTQTQWEGGARDVRVL